MLYKSERSHRFFHGRQERLFLAAAQGPCGRDDHFCMAILNPFAQGVCAEAGEYHTVHCADSRAGEHRHGLLDNEWHIQDHFIAFVHAETFQSVGKFIDPRKQVFIAHANPLVRLIPINQRDGVAAVSENMPVQTVIRYVQLATNEPLIIWKIPSENLAPFFKPNNFFGSDFAPKSFRIGDGRGVIFFELLVSCH